MNPRPLILIADDHSSIVKVMMRRLEVAGYDVVPAYDGEAVLAQTAQALPDLYILDIKMPRLSGYEVCARLRQNAVSAAIPVILMSGSSTETVQLMNRALELGAVNWLNKPFTSEELLDTVRRALTRHTHSRDEEGVP